MAAAETPVAAAPKNEQVVPPPQNDPKALTKATQSDTIKDILDRYIAMTKLEHEKKLSFIKAFQFIKAWEESAKSKVQNKAQKRHSKVTAWENSKKASLEAQLKKKQEQLERKREEYAVKMKDKAALIHKEAEEKRAMVEAKKGEELLKASETAAKFRAVGQFPKSGFGCFRS